MTFALVPPLVAVAAYFSTWHAVRHLVRLVTIDDSSRRLLTARADDRKQHRRSHLRVVWRLCRDAAPTTLGAVLFVGSLWPLAPYGDHSVPSVMGAYLVGLAALTVPHAGVVTWLDRVQDV